VLRIAEFEARKRRRGKFMDRRIERQNAVFYDRSSSEIPIDLPSPTFVGDHRVLRVEHARGGNPGRACPMQVYLDQIPLPTPFNLDLLPSPKQIAGIEVYSGPLRCRRSSTAIIADVA
jgi:hypothetical protein